MGALGATQLGTGTPPIWDSLLFGAGHAVGSNEQPYGEEARAYYEAPRPEGRTLLSGWANKPRDSLAGEPLAMVAHAPER